MAISCCIVSMVLFNGLLPKKNFPSCLLANIRSLKLTPDPSVEIFPVPRNFHLNRIIQAFMSPELNQIRHIFINKSR